MIDHILGKPNPSWKRTQVFLVMLFWIWRIVNGDRQGPRVLYLRRLSRALSRFTPWQIVASSLTFLYAMRNLDSIFGLGSAEPLARLYSRAYYRATWIVTGLDAGFATAMTIKTKWLRDLCSVLFSVYYIIYANEADEKLRKFRAVCTVEMLRVTWEKTSNPYIRAFTYFDRPRIPHVRQLLLPRPPSSNYKRPIAAWLFFSRPERELSSQTDLIIDIPGGGFISMSPANHEERLRRWAMQTGRPVLSIDYSKAPECKHLPEGLRIHWRAALTVGCGIDPFPFALDECFDAYRVIAESLGRLIGMSGKKLNIIMTGDSAGANLCVTTVFKILEAPTPILPPVAVVLNYACLDFNFTSWMTPGNMRVLRHEQSSGHLAGIAEQKDHYSHRSPLSVVKDVGDRRLRSKKSWAHSLSLPQALPSPFGSTRSAQSTPNEKPMPRMVARAKTTSFMEKGAPPQNDEEGGNVADEEGEDEDIAPEGPNNRPISAYVLYQDAETLNERQAELAEERIKGDCARKKAAAKTPIGTRLAMTSRTGYFQDRIIAPSMMRAMAILYIGPKHNPDFGTDYYLSPILASNALLARFPKVLMTCGEKDPFVDDTVIFAGRIREAKRLRKQELLRAKSTGAGLRMSAPANSAEERLMGETEEDWVQMEILEGWSHGYLQMTTLLPEALGTIEHIADWIRSAFADAPSAAPAASTATQALASPGGSARRRPNSGAHRESRSPPDLAEGAGFGVTSSETETETDSAVLTFVPKKRRSPPPSFGTGHAGRRFSSSSSTATVAAASKSSPSSDETLGPFTPPTGESLGGSAAAGQSPILGVAGSGRAGTPTKAGLLSEGQLMRRRMDEVVLGLGEVDGSSDV
ncbi:alpha/beta-hydrolase [Exidia glandulosa HHB12029]|uniref:Alpha/beta-hydrolase n=1 Tax=Exidia glandulosa HHB12029 TaxID=1314781 RepID=A0A165E748_EXIGL|nr:alpha/beta-hydrolase [Exidia glandulosa HHB12029]